MLTFCHMTIHSGNMFCCDWEKHVGELASFICNTNIYYAWENIKSVKTNLSRYKNIYQTCLLPWVHLFLKNSHLSCGAQTYSWRVLKCFSFWCYTEALFKYKKGKTILKLIQLLHSPAQAWSKTCVLSRLQALSKLTKIKFKPIKLLTNQTP